MKFRGFDLSVNEHLSALDKEVFRGDINGVDLIELVNLISPYIVDKFISYKRHLFMGLLWRTCCRKLSKFIDQLDPSQLGTPLPYGLDPHSIRQSWRDVQREKGDFFELCYWFGLEDLIEAVEGYQARYAEFEKSIEGLPF